MVELHDMLILPLQRFKSLSRSVMVIAGFIVRLLGAKDVSGCPVLHHHDRCTHPFAFDSPLVHVHSTVPSIADVVFRGLRLTFDRGHVLWHGAQDVLTDHPGHFVVLSVFGSRSLRRPGPETDRPQVDSDGTGKLRGLPGSADQNAVAILHANISVRQYRHSRVMSGPDTRRVVFGELEIAFVGIAIGAEDPAPRIEKVFSDRQVKKGRLEFLFFGLTALPGRIGLAGWG
jgi:hypothetical protein